MEIKLDEKNILNFTPGDIKTICEKRFHLYKDHDPCNGCPFHSAEGCRAKIVIV